MLRESKAFSGFAVKDVAEAKEFYGTTLGLDVEEQNDMLTLHLGGGRDTLVYPKPDFVPATYTILNFPVEDVDQTVEDLTAKGVTFERYEGMGQDDKGISRQGGGSIAWFADPAGNILSVLSM